MSAYANTASVAAAQANLDQAEAKLTRAQFEKAAISGSYGIHPMPTQAEVDRAYAEHVNQYAATDSNPDAVGYQGGWTEAEVADIDATIKLTPAESARAFNEWLEAENARSEARELRMRNATVAKAEAVKTYSKPASGGSTRGRIHIHLRTAVPTAIAFVAATGVLWFTL